MDKKAFEFPCGERAAVCGILNVTPDSFSDGGLYSEPERAVRRVRELLREGAELIDIGAQSTRPGAARIDADEETARLAPVLDALRGEPGLIFSIDTFLPRVARFALERGASVINDVSGRVNPDMVSLAREYGAGLIVVHSGGARGGDILGEVREFFLGALAEADALGLPRRSLCLDPGFGFGKDAAEDMRLLLNLKSVKIEGVSLMAALSRKRFIGSFSGIGEPSERDGVTAFACAAAILGGADIIRVHSAAAVLDSARAAFDAR